uniref:(northern house mosquito) hypothetical protein n=1 Tax=Culex pipiens TaxID=7175 RepID=A0A8D8ID70_CULPI
MPPCGQPQAGRADGPEAEEEAHPHRAQRDDPTDAAGYCFRHLAVCHESGSTPRIAWTLQDSYVCQESGSILRTAWIQRSHTQYARQRGRRRSGSKRRSGRLESLESNQR